MKNAVKERVHSVFQPGKIKPQFCIKQQIGLDDVEGEDKVNLAALLATPAQEEQMENYVVLMGR